MKTLKDSKVMFLRNMKISFRNPETTAMAIIAPTMIMLLFVYVFGGVMDVGEDISYVNFIIAGITLQCIAQGSVTTAININLDMKRGMVDRFRSMPISKASFLIGHSAAAVVRNIITASLIIFVAFAVGFRPEANFVQWLIMTAMFLLFILVINWLAILVGLLSKTAESASSLVSFIAVLPYVSSGFAPTERMPAGIRWFAENQPITPIINTIRAMITGTSAGNNAYIALAWCFGLLAVMFGLSLYFYRRRTSA